jgi:hypothetical protein
MKDFNQIEEVDQEVTDEALEAAAGTGMESAGHYTAGDCTGFVSCSPW